MANNFNLLKQMWLYSLFLFRSWQLTHREVGPENHDAGKGWYPESDIHKEEEETQSALDWGRLEIEKKYTVSVTLISFHRYEFMFDRCVENVSTCIFVLL